LLLHKTSKYDINKDMFWSMMQRMKFLNMDVNEKQMTE
jgi:hypothetical protein